MVGNVWTAAGYSARHEVVAAESYCLHRLGMEKLKLSLGD